MYTFYTRDIILNYYMIAVCLFKNILQFLNFFNHDVVAKNKIKPQKYYNETVCQMLSKF